MRTQVTRRTRARKDGTETIKCGVNTHRIIFLDTNDPNPYATDIHGNNLEADSDAREFSDMMLRILLIIYPHQMVSCPSYDGPNHRTPS